MLAPSYCPDHKTIAGENSPSHQQSCKLPGYGVLGCLESALLSTWSYSGLPTAVLGGQRVFEGGGSDPSSGPRRRVRTPVAVHLLPWEKVGNITGARTRQKQFPSPQGRGGTARRWVRGYFSARFTVAERASPAFRTNSSGCPSTIAFGMRNKRMPRVRKRSSLAASLRI